MPDYKDKRLVIIGAGVSGQGLAVLASQLGAKVFVTEQNKISDEAKTLFDSNNIDYEEGHSLKALENVDEILISSGIPPQSKILHDAQERGIKLTSELDFVLPNIKAQKLLCVTGSNGKSTVTSLIGHNLSRAGLKTGTGGNLGTASADFTRENFDVVVLELSSFQLARAKNNMHSQVAVITNLAPDHIDWHGNYNNYVEAKSRVLKLRDSEGWAIIQDRDAEILNPSGKIITLSWHEKPEHKFNGHIFMSDSEAFLNLDGKITRLFNYNDTDLIGSHNLENVAMSLCAVKLLNIFDVDDFGVKFLLEGFKPLPHRCENAGKINGVQYIDDSKGTNVAASITAMTSIKGRKIIILGGQGKGEDYAPLAESVKKECEFAILLGEEAEKIQEALTQANYKNVYRVSNMEEAVKLAAKLANSGMIVLLSPACTSWDMYKSYKARGEHFCNLVKELANNS